MYVSERRLSGDGAVPAAVFELMPALAEGDLRSVADGDHRVRMRLTDGPLLRRQTGYLAADDAGAERDDGRHGPVKGQDVKTQEEEQSDAPSASVGAAAVVLPASAAAAVAVAAVAAAVAAAAAADAAAAVAARTDAAAVVTVVQHAVRKLSTKGRHYSSI